MKKLISTLIIILLLMVSTVSMAAGPAMGLSFDNAKIEAGKEVKLYITVNDFAQGGNQNAIEFKLTYDSTKLEYKSTKGANEWAIQASLDGTGFVGTKTGTVNSSEKIAEITFKVKDNTEVGKINVSASDILVAVDINPEIELSNVSNSLEVIGTQEEETKPENNKPEDNKPEDNKPEDNKPEDNKPEDNKPQENKPEDNKQQESKPQDKIEPTKNNNKVSVNPTEKPKTLPKAGENDILLVLGGILLVIGIVSYKKVKKYKEI